MLKEHSEKIESGNKRLYFHYYDDDCIQISIGREDEDDCKYLCNVSVDTLTRLIPGGITEDGVDTPQHKYEIVVRTSGHNWDDLRINLENFLIDLALREPGKVNLIAGDGYMLVFEDVFQTKEKYFGQLKEWIAKRRSERESNQEEK